jgi:hypothetical protein
VRIVGSGYDCPALQWSPFSRRATSLPHLSYSGTLRLTSLSLSLRRASPLGIWGKSSQPTTVGRQATREIGWPGGGLYQTGNAARQNWNLNGLRLFSQLSVSSLFSFPSRSEWVASSIYSRQQWASFFFIRFGSKPPLGKSLSAIFPKQTLSGNSSLQSPPLNASPPGA